MSDLIGYNRIKGNPKDKIILICETLVKILERIIRNPNNLESRRLTLESAEVSENLMPYDGGLEVLFELGFQEDDDSFVLPFDVSPQMIESFRDRLNSVIKETKEPEIKATAPLPVKTKTEDQQAQACSVPSKLSIRPGSKVNLLKNINNNQFAQKLQNSYEHVMIYEDPDLKRKAIKLIPVDRLTQEASAKFAKYREESSAEKSPYDLEDFLLIELLAWFKNEFFKWVNQAECENCQNPRTVFKRNDRPNHSELTWMANSVECYECPQCTQITRFPRYNHPGKLLDTRKGRCGEWANCFCMCLRALNFDARYVLDWTDHVWCEVYARSQRRWLHADPCENALDKPLIYEHGWQKKLTYVVAFSRHECIDVTWRYSTMHREVLKRRHECDEIWMVKQCNELSRRRQAGLSKSERDFIQLRLVGEIAEFLSPKTIKEGEDVGRQSGSLQWRLDRGEIQTAKDSVNYKFKVDFKHNEYLIEYNTVRDQYLCSSGESAEKTELKNWASGVYDFSNIQLKIEHDWRMCYLARTVGSNNAHIDWFFDLGHISSVEKTKISKIKIIFDYSCFESGSIKLSVQASRSENESLAVLELEQNKSGAESYLSYVSANNVYTVNFNNESPIFVKLRADMTKGSGENAWQHTQLFRQNLDDANNSLFSVRFYFDKS